MGIVWSAVDDHGMDVLASGDNKKVSNLIIEIVYHKQNFLSCRILYYAKFCINLKTHMIYKFHCKPIWVQNGMDFTQSWHRD